MSVGFHSSTVPSWYPTSSTGPYTAAPVGDTTSGGTSMGPLLAAGIPAAASFFSSLFGASKQSKENRLQRQWLEQQAALDRAARQRQHDETLAATRRGQDLAEGQNQRNTALDEAKLDPWRHTMAQVGHAANIDRLAGTTYEPVRLEGGQGGRLTRRGGTNYRPSDELVQAARAAAQMILSGGGQAPTMLDPANYGRTGVTDLRRGGAPVVDLGGGRRPVSTTMPVDDPWQVPIERTPGLLAPETYGSVNNAYLRH